ncbi:MAG: DsbA family oxidoreductase [Oleiphilaceae bacterium]|nr:DsbA family oxidoreductase [Oleiphilaceae bacterium]
MTPIRIDIVSDVACPWCAIGYARLEQAMEALKDELDFHIEWHAFELNPDRASDGEPILQALSRKYGRSEAEMEQAQSDMMAIAEDLGLNFTRMQSRFTRNTFDAHRLLKWAGDQGRQTALKKAFFEAYFGYAEDISDHEVLLRWTESAGLDAAAAREVLESKDYAEAVLRDEAHYQKAGISGVPAFIINQKYLISGAQEADYLSVTLRDIAREQEAATGS